jgi:prolyl 4-hydroxylase
MIKVIESFISADEAQCIINSGDSIFHAAKTLGREIKDYRVAENAVLKKELPAVKNIIQSVAALTNTPVANQEDPQLIKYNTGGEYKPHYDFFPKNFYFYKKLFWHGGQRLKSCLLYLNEDFEGGETNFSRINLTIKPKTGKLVIWENMNVAGSLNYISLHAGLPVISGTKYVLIIFIREKKYS